jgi:hypothetical protein
MMHPTRKWIGRLGAAAVFLAAGLSVAASVNSVGDYLAEYGSWCGTERKQVIGKVDHWAPSLALVAGLGWALSVAGRCWPRTCRTAAAATLVVCLLTCLFVHGGMNFLWFL